MTTLLPSSLKNFSGGSDGPASKTYTSEMTLVSNDPARPSLTVPLEILVRSPERRPLQPPPTTKTEREPELELEPEPEPEPGESVLGAFFGSIQNGPEPEPEPEPEAEPELETEAEAEAEREPEEPQQDPPSAEASIEYEGSVEFGGSDGLGADETAAAPTGDSPVAES